MESSIHNSSTSSAKFVALNYEMDSCNEDIDLQVLRAAGEETINAEWSATASASNSSDTTSSNSYINIETLKECCANPSDTLKDKEDFMVFESSSIVVNISKFNANDTKYYSECKTTAFQKKHKPLAQNVSRCFENILDDDSQMEITQNSICLNRFQKRKRLMPPNDEDFLEINNSNYSGSNSVEVSMMKSPKFYFSRKKKNQLEVPDYNLSATDSDSIAGGSGGTNISKRTNTSNYSLVINDSSNNINNVSKTEVFTKKFSLKSIGVVDSAFENIINNSSIISDITLNNKKTSLNETALSNVNNTSVFSKMDLSNLNHTYDIPNNTNSTLVKASTAGDANTPKVKKNTVFKKPSNLSILVNDSSNNIMDVSKTEVFTQKFSRKSIGVPDSAFDNIINDSSMTSEIALNNKKSSSIKTSVSNINNSKMDMSNLNYTYDIPTHINTSTIDVCIADDANIPSLKQNTVFQKPLNTSILVNDNSNSIRDVSKTEVLTPKFSRKTIDVADSVFENIIYDSSIISDITLSDKNTNSTETPGSNVNNSVLKKIDMSNLNHTYDIPTIIDVSIAGDANIPEVEQNTDLKKPTNSSIVINDNSNSIRDVSKTEVFTHKFSRKTIDVTHSVFENIINDSSMKSDIVLNNNKISLIETSESNVNNTPVFGTRDISNSNHTCDLPMNNNTTLLDTIVEHDKSMSETPVLLQNNRSKSFNLLPLKFNFSNKFGRHSLSLQENCPSYDGVKKHNISLNTDFSKNNREESTFFHKSANNSNANLESHLHISIIQENDNGSQEIQPLDNSLPTNTSNQEQLKSRRSICSNSNNKDLLSNTTTTKSLENNEFQKNQPNHSTSSNFSNEGLTLLNSTTGLLGSCSSSRTQSRLLISKQSEISTSNNDTLNLSIESLDSNKSQNDQSRHSISSTSSNEGLTLINSIAEFSGTHSSSKNKSTWSKHSTSVISNNDSLTSLNATTGISVGGRSSSTSSKHSSSATSNNDSLTLLNTTVESLKINESQNTQSKSSISPTSYNESLKSTNSTTGVSGRRSSSRNKTSSISSKHSTSIIENGDGLILLNASMESFKSNESPKPQSKCSISLNSHNESLKSTNSTTRISERRSSSKNKSSSTSSMHSTSAISNNDSFTSLNDSTEISVGSSSSRNKSSSTSSKHSSSATSNNDGLTLLNTTMESLNTNESRNTQTKRSISPTSYNESIKSTNSTAGFSEKRSLSRNKSSSTSSKHLIGVISNNENSTLLNAATGISGSSRLSRNKSSILTSKHSTSAVSNNDSLTSLNDTTGISVGITLRNQSKHSTSVISNNDSLTLLNTTVGSLKSNESQNMQSKRSVSPTSYNESIKSMNSTTGFTGRRSSSRNKSSFKHSTSVISNNDTSTLLSAAPLISGSDRSSRNKSSLLTSKHSSSVVSNNDSLPLFAMGSSESSKSPKTQSTSPTLNIENLKTLITNTGSLRQAELSINRSTSKHSSSIISGKTLILEDVINNVSRMSARLSKQKSNISDNVEPLTSIIIDGLSNSDGLMIKNTTARPLKQEVLSINQSNSFPNISIKTPTNGLILDGDANNVSKMYASSSKLKNKSSDNEQMMQDITDGPLLEPRPSTTRVLRSSLRTNKNKSLKSDNNVNNLSISTTRTSKNVANFDNNSDNSLFWTTLPDESTNISSTQNVNMNTFQTPKRNKLSIAENIVNTIKIMSTNNKKSTHPGVFELDDHNDGPLTKSFVTRSYNRSPSILTLVFGGQKPSESTSSLTRSPSEIIFDQSQVEENVKQKFKSLYTKESWITKRLYKFLIIKLQPNYNIYSVKYAEKFVKYLARLLKQIYNDQVNLQLCTDMLRYHMARYHIIKDTFDYLGFLTDYIPMAYYKKLVPGWNLETSAVKFDPQKYYIPLMDDEEFLNYIMEHLNEA